jgi:putative sterol carrier protein
MTDETIFPSEAWFQEYKNKVNESEEYSEKSAGWGVDFDGDFIFKMTDMPVDEIDTSQLPEKVQEELEAYVHETDSEGYVGYSYVALEDGACSEAFLIESPAEVDNGFMYSGTYDTWIELMEGNVGAVDGLMSGKFDLDGDMQKILQYSDAATILTELAGSVDATYAHEYA